MKNRKYYFFAATLIVSFFLMSCGQQEAGKKTGQALVASRVSEASISIDGLNNDWDAVGTLPLSGLRWVGALSKSKPADESRLRIRSVSVAHDGKYLFLLLNLEPGIQESFEKEGRTGSLSYIVLDSDADEATGEPRDATDSYAGWDYRIYIPTGFKEGAGSGSLKPLVEYKIEKIKKATIGKVPYGYSYDAEYEDVSGGDKNSVQDTNFIAFQENYLELRFSLHTLTINIPTRIKMVIQDLSAFPDAETQIELSLQ